jgi:hypothetical protein
MGPVETNVGYDLGVILQSVFTMRVLMALPGAVMTIPAPRRQMSVKLLSELDQGKACEQPS